MNEFTTFRAGVTPRAGAAVGVEVVVTTEVGLGRRTGHVRVRLRDERDRRAGYLRLHGCARAAPAGVVVAVTARAAPDIPTTTAGVANSAPASTPSVRRDLL